MQTTDQVAGEAREKLAHQIEAAVRELADDFRIAAAFYKADWLTIVAALRAQPERGAEEMRERAAKACETEAGACLSDIVADDALGAKLARATASGLLTVAADIRALPLHPAKDEGGGR